MAKFYLMGNTSDCQMFGCVILTQNKTIVIDGGTVDDTDQLVSFLKERANSHVDAWFFTHPHPDHFAASGIGIPLPAGHPHGHGSQGVPQPGSGGN